MNSKCHLDDDDTSIYIYMSAEELMLLNCGVGENSWEPLGLQGDLTSPSYRKSVLNIHWKDWCWSWHSNTLVTWCKLTHWKKPWCWARLKAGGEGDNRGWDDWVVSPAWWVWPSFSSWWWTGKPGNPWGHKESDMTEWLNWGCYNKVPQAGLVKYNRNLFLTVWWLEVEIKVPVQLSFGEGLLLHCRLLCCGILPWQNGLRAFSEFHSWWLYPHDLITS